MKRIAVALSVLTVLVLAAPAGAELCEKCKGKMYIANVGQCVECGGLTGSGAHKLCRKCSARLGQCEHCRAPLKGAKRPADKKPTPPKPAKIDWRKSGTYTTGKWKYEYTYISGSPGKRRFTRYALLFYDGKPVAKITGAKEGDRIKTPWGMMQYFGRVLKEDYRTRVDCWLRARHSKGRLLPSPGKSAPAYLRALELDESANGKTVSAIVGQQIIIRLKGAPMPGHMWNPAKFKGDAIEQVGQMKFVPGARPRPVFVPGPRHQQPGPVPGARPQPIPGGLVAHTVGGPGKYVFTFRAVKAGKAEVTIKGRLPRAGHPARTFTLTVDIKADPTAERVRKLKANLDKFSMTICYRGQGPRGGRPPRWCRHITLSVPPAMVPRTPSWRVRQISKNQAGKIIDQLAKTGFLARATPRAAPVRKMGDRYALAVYMRKPGPRSPMLMDIMENIGWGPQLLKRLEGLGLKEVLDGDAAKAVDFLLEPLAERFRKEKKSPAPAKIDTKKSGKYTSGKWKYDYRVSAVGTRSERRFSGLTYDGNLIAGAKMWDRIKTPWGMMQYYQMSYVRGWMLELTGGTPINPKKGRLLTLPEASATPSHLRPLELDKSHNGKTVSAVVGQEIIIRLKSNPTTGYQWVVGKIEGDALGQIGLVKYEQRKHGPGMVGVGGKEVFTFRTTKVGAVKLTLEYKGPGKKIARTFTLTVNVKPAPAKHSASYLRPLEVDDSHNGKTVPAIVGQEIIIRLKGNATTGYSWVVGKNEGDALGQVGKVKYVSDQPPAPAGGRGGRLMIHRVGGGGKYVFTFRATKAGTAKLTLEYKRGWEKDKPPAKTFTLTVNVKADRTAERVKKLKANLDKKDFELVLRYHGPKGKPAYMSLGLVWSRQTVRALGKGGGGKRPAPANIRAVAVAGKPNPNVMRMGNKTYVRITKKQDIIKIIDHLAKDGFLNRAVAPPRY